jgi:hypothetical protein
VEYLYGTEGEKERAVLRCIEQAKPYPDDVIAAALQEILEVGE